MGLWKNSKPQSVSSISELHREQKGVYIVEGLVSSRTSGQITISDEDSSIVVIGDIKGGGPQRLKLNKTTSGYTLIKSESLQTVDDIQYGKLTGRVRANENSASALIETPQGNKWIQYSQSKGIF